jgi:hypothetical protein
MLVAADRGVFVLTPADPLPVALPGGTNVGTAKKLRGVGYEQWLVETAEGLHLFNAATKQLKALAATDHNIGDIQEYRDLASGTALIRTDRLYRLDVAKETLELLPLGISRVSRVLSGESMAFSWRRAGAGWWSMPISQMRNFYRVHHCPSSRVQLISGRDESFSTLIRIRRRRDIFESVEMPVR